MRASRSTRVKSQPILVGHQLRGLMETHAIGIPTTISPTSRPPRRLLVPETCKENQTCMGCVVRQPTPTTLNRLKQNGSKRFAPTRINSRRHKFSGRPVSTPENFRTLCTMHAFGFSDTRVEREDGT
jgi:hypothetical protein